MFTKAALLGVYGEYLIGCEMLRKTIEKVDSYNLNSISKRYLNIKEYVENTNNFKYSDNCGLSLDSFITNLYEKLYKDFGVFIVQGYHKDARGVVFSESVEEYRRREDCFTFETREIGYIFTLKDYFFTNGTAVLVDVKDRFCDYDVEYEEKNDFYIFDSVSDELLGSSYGDKFINNYSDSSPQHCDIFIDSEVYDYYNRCEECGDWINVDYGCYCNNRGFLCNECIEDLNLFYCESCGEYIDRSDCNCFDCSYYNRHGCELGEEKEEEWNEENRKNTDDVYSIVQKRRGYSSINYSRDPENVIFSTKNGIDFECFDDSIRRCLKGPVFAVEIESLFDSYKIEDYNSIDNLNNLVVDEDDGVDDRMAQFMVKNDCSLLENSNDENDFEFTPLNLCRIDDYAAVKYLYKDFFEYLRKSGFYKTSDCGGHIHIDLNRYNDNSSIKNSKYNNKLRLYNLVKAAYVIQVSLDDRVKDLFGRSFGPYRNRYDLSKFSCFFEEIKMLGIENIYNSAEKWLNKGSHDYFYNFTGGTFEFRIPGGISTYADLCSRLAAIKALLDYVEDKEVYDLRWGINSEIMKLQDKYYFKYYCA